MKTIQRIAAWLGGIAFVLICFVVIAGFAFHATVIPMLEHEMFVTKSKATNTPETFAAPYKSLDIDSHGRSLHAWIVDAGADTPSLLLFSGNGQTIHDWAQVQAFLYRQHVSSMVFNYSGFGKSTGTPTVQHLNQDARAAWRAFTTWAGTTRPKFVVAYSLGTAVALHNVASFEPHPLGIAVYGAFSSARDLMVYLRALPSWFAPFTPDLWDSVSAASRLGAPLLVVAGMNDTNVPPDMSRPIALYAAAGDGGRFVLVPDAGHGGIVDKHMAAVWAQILAFMKNRVNEGIGSGGKNIAGQNVTRNHDPLSRVVQSISSSPASAVSNQ